MQETRETWVGSLGQEAPLERRKMATHSSILAWKFSRTEEPGQRSPWGRKELHTTEHTHIFAWVPLKQSPKQRHVQVVYLGRGPRDPILWPPGVKNQPTGKDPDDGKD